MIQPVSKCRNRQVFKKLSQEQLLLAKKYLQGAVHSFCKNNPGEPFSLRDLVGGENKDWGETPLQPIYDYYRHTLGRPDKSAKRQAAVDAGWLLKAVLFEEKNRYFEQLQGTRAKQYRRIR